MLSDLLLDTIEQIDAWLEESPGVYDRYRDDLEKLKADMRSLAKRMNPMPLFDDDGKE